MLAPIIVFAYNRPVHLKRCIESLLANAESAKSDVIVFIDGPKTTNDKTSVEECIKIADKISGFRSVKVIARKDNLGLAKSIRSGIDEIFQSSEKVIVFEDDIFASSSALRFLNFGLDKYFDFEKVASVQLYQYPLKKEFAAPVFLRGADCWGWATWKDRWEKVNFDSDQLLRGLSPIRKEFNLGGSARYFEMLEELGKGTIDSWAICWHASMYLENKVSLYPPIALCRNTGSDGTGTHASNVDYFAVNLDDATEWNFPKSVEENDLYRDAMSNFHKSLRQKAMMHRIRQLFLKFRFTKKGNY